MSTDEVEPCQHRYTWLRITRSIIKGKMVLLSGISHCTWKRVALDAISRQRGIGGQIPECQPHNHHRRGYLLGFVRLCRLWPHKPTEGPLPAEQFKEAEVWGVGKSQEDAFAADLRTTPHRNAVPAGGRLNSLIPFFGSDEILRMGKISSEIHGGLKSGIWLLKFSFSSDLLWYGLAWTCHVPSASCVFLLISRAFIAEVTDPPIHPTIWIELPHLSFSGREFSVFVSRRSCL